MTDIQTQTAATPENPTAVIRRVATASAVGTAAEYYDFFAYGTAAVLFFGHLFFPSTDPLISTLAAFATMPLAYWRVRWAA